MIARSFTTFFRCSNAHEIASSTILAPLEVMQFLRFGFARVYEYESLSLWESRALRPGEGCSAELDDSALYGVKKPSPAATASDPPARGKGMQVFCVHDLETARPHWGEGRVRGQKTGEVIS